jgi:hypothetical protein
MDAQPYAGPDRRKPGRPARVTPYETLHLRVSVELYDRIDKLARRVDKPLSVAARMMLERELKRVEALIR